MKGRAQVKGGALVLAAGASLRFGSDKRAYRLNGRPLLEHTVGHVLEAGLDCRVCLRPGDGHIPLLLAMPGVEYLECPGAPQGMGVTLAEGVAACDDWERLLVVLGDMAWVRPATLLTLFRALSSDGIVQPLHGGLPGNPVGFGRRFSRSCRHSAVMPGAVPILACRRGAVRRVEVDDPGIHLDLDRPPE